MKSVVVRFSGDSGDGIQLAGNQFTDTSAIMGNDVRTLPDFPAEIRAPAGTVAGVSGFQIQFGSAEVQTPGDAPDVLIALNPAALKADLFRLKKSGTLIVDTDAFTAPNLKLAGYASDPLEDEAMKSFQVIRAPISSQTLKALENIDLKPKEKLRCRNFYALGMSYFLYQRSLDNTLKWIEKKFGKNPTVLEANQTALKKGYYFSDIVEASISTYSVERAELEPGRYRNIRGNQALTWGLTTAAQAAELDLFFGSYPITPASDILHELAKLKGFGVQTFQAEDEMAAVCSSIGAAFAGSLGVTASSGPGIALKTEAIGYAVMTELPLVVVDAQRGGPSTGLPTRTEQTDLKMAFFGRNGESPLVILAPSTPADCFEMAYEACRLALQHMTPVMILTDGYLANGSEPWRLPDMARFSKIEHGQMKNDDGKDFQPYARNENLVRPWVVPQTPGKMHRLGGLEKSDVTGNVSYDPDNHQRMSDLRQKKIERVAQNIPAQEIDGPDQGDCLVISWGSTFGSVRSAVTELRTEGIELSHMHIRYLNPFPQNLGDQLKGFKRFIIPELNFGHLSTVLLQEFHSTVGGKMKSLSKVQGQPFRVWELKAGIKEHLGHSSGEVVH